jgi:hypothetical protein
MNEEGIDAYARDLHLEVEEAVQSGDGSLYQEVEFTRILLEQLAEAGAVENPILLWQEGSFHRTRYKITGYAMPEDAERLLLVTTIYTGENSPRVLGRDKILTACQQAVNFYASSCKGLYKEIEPSNTDASDLARRIYEERNRITVLRVLLLSDGLTGLKSADTKETIDSTRVIVDLYGIERLHRTLGEGLTRDDIVLDFREELGAPVPGLRISGPGVDYEAYLTAVPGRLLANTYEKYGMRLLELNVRAFLGLRGRKSVNAGLRSTIIKEPHRFLAYNNGIVATVDSVNLVELENGAVGISAVRGLQIVNGGQTTASLHRARRQDKASLDAIAVPIKIIHVGGGNLDQMVAAVSRSANSQNTVQPADFSANDPFHVAVEQLANNTWLPGASGRWFYERARGSFDAAEANAAQNAARKRRFQQETPKSRRFSKTDLAKYLNAWNGEPHLVSFGNQKNFQLLMQAMKDDVPDDWRPDAVWYRAFIAKAILFRAVQEIVHAAKFSAYQANITAYTVAALSWRVKGEMDFEMIWRQQAISQELTAMLGAWAKIVDTALRETAGSRMPSEWAKKEACRDQLRELPLNLPEPLPPELTAYVEDVQRRATGHSEGLPREDMELIDACRKISAETWLGIAHWGAKSKRLHWKVVGVVNVVGNCAISEWEKSPSAKQAKSALEAYRKALKEGVVSGDAPPSNN